MADASVYQRIASALWSFGADQPVMTRGLVGAALGAALFTIAPWAWSLVTAKEKVDQLSSQSIYLDCKMAFWDLLKKEPPAGEITAYSLIKFNSQYGFAKRTSPIAGAFFQLPDNNYPVSPTLYRCEISSYAKDPLFRIAITLEGIVQTTAARDGTIRDTETKVPLTVIVERLDSNKSFVFYIFTEHLHEYVRMTAPDRFTFTSLDRTSGSGSLMTSNLDYLGYLAPPPINDSVPSGR